MRAFLATLVVASFVSLAGCVSDERTPRLELAFEPEPVPMDDDLTLRVTFENTAPDPFLVQGAQGCVFPRAVALVDDERVPFEWPDGELMDCASVDEVTIEPGERREWTLRLALGEYTRGGASIFQPGRTYPVEVELAAEATSWDVGARSSFRVLAAVARPIIGVEPAPGAWFLGEPNSITATFTNTLDVNYTYTSSDTCNDIRVWVEDADGDNGPVYLWPAAGPYACGAALTHFTVEPGDVVTTTVVWDGSRSSEGGAPYAAAGTYTVKADLLGMDHAWRVEGQAVLTIHDPQE